MKTKEVETERGRKGRQKGGAREGEKGRKEVVNSEKRRKERKGKEKVQEKVRKDKWRRVARKVELVDTLSFSIRCIPSLSSVYLICWLLARHICMAWRTCRMSLPTLLLRKSHKKRIEERRRGERRRNENTKEKKE